MFNKSQLIRGVLEGCILKIICDEETYGYEIIEKLNSYGFRGVKEGTIYPLLVRLEKRKFINSELRPSPLGPHRKYYFITKNGKLKLKLFELSWNDITKTVNKIFKKEIGD